MNNNMKVLRIGIASRAEMRARTMAIARGELKPSSNDPKVWFPSIKSVAEVLSNENRLLLEIIRRMSPASVKELAEISGRKPGNLSRTLHTMERYKLVELERCGGTVTPRVPYDRVSFDLALEGVQGAVPISFQAAQNERARSARLG
jgi:predicted transcriptional regulator